jgi:T5SS/PEP-CTERM-associated repeat protein
MTPLHILHKRNICLNSGASVAALVLGVVAFISTPAFADPSITYTGSVTPPPPQGITNWIWSKPEDSAGRLFVGLDNDVATLEIRDGATASGAVLYLGNSNAAGASGNIIVDGKGSILSIHRNFQVGYNPNSSGVLTISNGGRVNADSTMVIGPSQGSQG